MDQLPLENVRILDFTWALAGPFSTMHLAFMGAEVIKVESVKGSIGRGQSTTAELSPSFHAMNQNKLSCRLDLSNPKGVELAKKLVQKSDVAVDNFRPGVMDRFGLGYADLCKIKPDIIMASASSGGSVGPERRYPGYASIFNATSGLGYATGYAGGPPTELRWSIDLRAGAATAFAIMAALCHRQTTGEGQFIDESAREAISCLVGDVLMDYTLNGRSPTAKANDDDVMAPHNCYPCKGEDKWVSIAVGSEEEWSTLCQVLGNPAWTKDQRFSDSYGRKKHQTELDEHLSAWTKNHTSFEVTQTLQKAGVAAMPSFDMEEIVHNPHLNDRGALVEIETPGLGKLTLVAAPWKLSEAPPVKYRPGPLFGEHNDYVFGELLGLSKEEITKLIDEKVIN